MKRTLPPVAVVVIAVALALGYVHLADRQGNAPAPGTPAPGLRLPSLAGAPVDLASFRGKVVVLNFWATWCPPCVAEMPSLERLYRALSPEGLAVVTVSADEDESDLRDFVRRHALTMPVLLDPGGRIAASRYGVTGYPVTFVIDRAGLLVKQYVGPAQWDTPGALAHFRELLGNGSVPAAP